MLKKNLVNLRLAVFIVLSLVLGILTAYFFKLENVVFGVITAVIFLALLTAFFFLFFEKSRVKANCVFVSIFLLFFVIGLSLFSVQISMFEKADLDGHYFTVQGKVSSKKETDTGTAVVLSNVHLDGIVEGETSYKITLYVYGDNDLDTGNYIKFNATLKDNSIIYENKFSPYNIANGVKYTASVSASEIELISNDLSVFEHCNLFFRDTLKSGLDYDEFTIAYGMLTGDDEMMNDNIITTYRYLGVAHVFAVSGLHIGFLATALNFLLKKLKVKPYLKAIIITAVLFFYSGICGFTASSLRATIMSAVMLFLSAKGERYDGLSAVAIAGIILLIMSPVQLFCVGFQLSFTVVIGILLLAKPIERFLLKRAKFIPKKVSASLGVVLSAQLAGIPISLMSFGYFSPISIIANFILIPILGVIFYLLFAFTILGGILTIPHITLFIPNYALKVINIVLTAIDSEKLLITGITFGTFTIVYYVAMIIPSGIFNLRLKTKVITTLVAIITFVVGVVTINTVDSKNINVYVCGSNSASVTVVSTGEENVLVFSSVQKVYSLGNLRRLSNKNGILDIDAVVFGGGFEYDMQVCITRLRQVFNLKDIYYYGATDYEMEMVMEKSFESLNLYALTSGQDFALSSIDVSYTDNGLGVNVVANEKRIVVLSTQDDFNGYHGVTGKIDFLIAGQNFEQLNYWFTADKIVAYRETTGFEDGESKGNFSLSFK